ncbi:hypothetical protein BDV10DRAFT_189111 [Aspergillus recurvatus]
MISSSFLALVPALMNLALAESFNLYAYGAAVISQNTPKDANETAVVSFTTSSGRLVGNPNATSTDSPFSDALLYIPGPESTSHEIGFANDTGSVPTDELTNRFVWYGHFLLVENDEGEFTSLFSVRESASEGEYSLLWNVTDSDEDVITISMRSIAPSKS